MLLRASVRSFSADLLNTRTVCCQSRLLAGSWRLQQTCSTVIKIIYSEPTSLRQFLTLPCPSRMGCWPRYFGLLGTT